MSGDGTVAIHFLLLGRNTTEEKSICKELRIYMVEYTLEV
jgi:hypothetical protein